MSKTAYFLLKTRVYDDNDIAEVATEVEQNAEAVCVDYMWLDDYGDGEPYIGV